MTTEPAHGSFGECVDNEFHPFAKALDGTLVIGEGYPKQVARNHRGARRRS